MVKKKGLIISTEKYSCMRLRSITSDDIESLRMWKNRNRERFFYKEIIAPDEQKIWFQNYLQRDDDWIFIAEIADVNREWERFGCLGYRIIDGTIDLYSIIRGKQTDCESSMRSMMELLTSFLCQRYDMVIKCDVLIDNPAVEWYNKCDFFVTEQKIGYYIMEFDRKKQDILKIEQEGMEL